MFYHSSEHAPHGFRSTASTLLNERGHGSALIELQLVHVKRDRVAAIYDRAQKLSERRRTATSLAS
jgi:integrase